MVPPAVPAPPETISGYRIDQAVLNGIRRASQETGVDFGYLMAQAAQESSFQPAARATTSSASGLYQFIESTWLQMMREHGAKYGHGALARRIEPDPAGGFRVNDPISRQRILDLRFDPRTAAALGAEYARSNQAQLEQTLGRPVAATDLYVAHFLGPTGAGLLLKAIAENSSRPAAELLPRAAAANPEVFYGPGGRPRTVGELYRDFQQRIERKVQVFGAEAGPAAAPPAVELAGTAPGRQPVAAPSPYGKPVLSLFSVVALSAYELIGSLRVPGSGDEHDRRS